MYIPFLADLNANDGEDSSDGQMGIMAIEIMPISSRITAEAMLKDEMCQEIYCILKAHGWERFALASHSWVPLHAFLAFSLFLSSSLLCINFSRMKLRKRSCYASPSHATDRTEDWTDFIC